MGSPAFVRCVLVALFVLAFVSAGSFTLPGAGAVGTATGTFFGTYGGSETAQLRSLLKQEGVQSVRVYIEWAELEPTEADNLASGLPSNAKLASYEERLLGLKANGIKPILMVGRAPTWAAARERGPLLAGKDASFARFLGKLVARWSVASFDVHHWELWPEPDFGDVLPSNAPASYAARKAWGDAGAAYANMLKLAYPAIKAGDATATVIMGALAHDNFRDNGVKPGDNNSSPGFNGGGSFVYHFLTDVIDAGGAPFFDWIGFNSYSAFSTEWERNQRLSTEWERNQRPLLWDVAAKAKHIQDRLTAKGVTKPLIVMEAGIWSCCAGPAEVGFTVYVRPDGTNHYYVPTERDQGAYMARLYARGLAADLKGIHWWLIEDFEAPTAQKNPDDNRGWFRFPDKAPKAAAKVFEIMTSRLNGATFGGVYTPAKILNGGVEAYSFTRPNGSTLLMLWSPYGPTETAEVEITIPRGFSAYNAFGEPVTATYVGSDRFKLTLGFIPIYVELLAATPQATPTLAPVSTVVPSTGGTVRVGPGAGTLAIEVPSGALTGSTTFAFTSRPLPTAVAGRQPVAAFQLLADGGAKTQFSADLTLTFRYDLATLGNVDERTLAIFLCVGRDPELRYTPEGRTAPSVCSALPSTVDTILRTVTAFTRHFTDFELAGGELPVPTPRPTNTPARNYVPVAGRGFSPP